MPDLNPKADGLGVYKRAVGVVLISGIPAHGGVNVGFTSGCYGLVGTGETDAAEKVEDHAGTPSRFAGVLRDSIRSARGL